MKHKELEELNETEVTSVKFIDKVKEKEVTKELTPTEEILDTFIKHKLINPKHETIRVI